MTCIAQLKRCFKKVIFSSIYIKKQQKNYSKFEKKKMKKFKSPCQ